MIRDSEHPYRDEEINGILQSKNGKTEEYIVYPEFNVFFYSYPFVAESFINTKYVHVFEVARDVEVVMGVRPSQRIKVYYVL
jgi:hypothetical protein